MALAELGPRDTLYVRTTIIKILLQMTWENICFHNDLGEAIWGPACGSSGLSSCSLSSSRFDIQANLLLLELEWV